MARADQGRGSGRVRPGCVIPSRRREAGPDKRVEMEAVIAILENKRVEVMSVRRAGYFIQVWQEITDQVRQMIFHDARYQAIKTKREARRV